MVGTITGQANRKGLNYEEYYGAEKAQEIRQKLSRNAARTMLGKKGSLCPNWKGGRFLQKRRVMIYAPDHPKADIYGGYIPEHILVWEQANGLSVPDGYDAHHKNGMPYDNRSENLEIRPHGDHSAKRWKLMKEELAILKRRVTLLEAENALLKELIK